jgi:hypothetical protein
MLIFRFKGLIGFVFQAKLIIFDFSHSLTYNFIVLLYYLGLVKKQKSGFCISIFTNILPVCRQFYLIYKKKQISVQSHYLI